MELFEKVLPFEWNSFCISLSPDKVQVYHNGQVQGTQTLAENGDGKHLKLMTTGLIGGAKFTGIISDLQIFHKAMPGEDLEKWTECQTQVSCENKQATKCDIIELEHTVTFVPKKEQF